MNRLQLDLSEINQKLEQYLSPHNFVVGLKLSESVGEMERVPGRRKLDFHPRLCQVITLARTFGWTVGFTSQDLASTTCGSVVGLCERDKVVTDGTLLSGVFFKDEKEARKQQESIPLIPAGTCKAGAVAPLRKNKFIPDIILVYGNPAQMMRLMTGIQWSDYERLQFFYSGEGACVDSIVQCYQTRKPALTVPCFGERRFGHVRDDEMVMGLPLESIDKVVEGLEQTEKSGIRFPIPYFGTQAGTLAGMPEKYRKLRKDIK